MAYNTVNTNRTGDAILRGMTLGVLGTFGLFVIMASAAVVELSAPNPSFQLVFSAAERGFLFTATLVLRLLAGRLM